MPECPWDQQPVAAKGDTCTEECYRRWLGVYGNSIVPDEVSIPNEHWNQPWYQGSAWRGGLG